MSISRYVRWPAVVALAAAFATLAGAFAPGISGQEGSEDLLFQVVAPPEEVEKGLEDIVVEVRAANADNLGAFGFQLEFDAAILEVAIDPATQQPLVQRGDFLGSSGREVACNDPASQPGVLRLECVTLRLEPPEGAEGEGLLASVTFKSIGSGTSPLTLERVQANNPDATAIDPIQVQSSQLIVKSDDGQNWLLWGGIIVVGAVVAVGAAFGAMKLRGRGGPPTATAA